MRVDIVSKRYAIAFYEALKESGKFDSVFKELKELVSVIKESQDFITFIKSPLIKKDEKLKFFQTLKGEGKISSDLFNFLTLLVNKGRISLLPGIYEYMNYLDMEDKGEVVAEVIAAFDVNDDLKSEIKASLEKISGKKVVLDVKVDKSIIAGLVARIKSQQLDASVKGQLNRLKERMIG